MFKDYVAGWVEEPTKTYAAFHGLLDWTERTVQELKLHTDRRIHVRYKDDKATSNLPRDLKNAHALVTHGSNAAIESVILGTPVFVDPSSAAKHVGKTNLSVIEDPIMPDRTEWLNALAYSHFTEGEILNGKAFEFFDGNNKGSE